MSSTQHLFSSSADTTLYCGRCERALEGHDDAACARKMSRRFFFGVCAGIALAPTKPSLRLLNPYFIKEFVKANSVPFTMENFRAAADMMFSLRDQPAPLIYLPPQHPFVRLRG